ncbi:MAG: nucleotidyltransferase domain-containing protein [Chromatiaceae bacterium]
MGAVDFSKLERRWQAEREARVARSARLRRLLMERRLAVLRDFGVQRAWLFGSVLEGTAGTTSDIDLLAVPVAPTDYWPLRRDLEAALNYPIDLYTQDDDRDLVRKVQERGELVDEVQP